MSVILDALKKAQQERKTISRKISFGFTRGPAKPKRTLYIVISCILCFILILTLLPILYKALISKPQTPVATQSLPSMIVHPQQMQGQMPEKTQPATLKPPTQVIALSEAQPQITKKPEETVMPDKPGATKTGIKKYEHKQTETKIAKTEQTAGNNDAEIAKKRYSEHINKLRKQASRKTASFTAEHENKEFNEPIRNTQVVVKRVNDEKITLLYNEALKEANKGNIDEAKKIYMAILVERPNHIEVLNNLGALAMKEGNTREAMFYFRKILENRKDYEKAYNNIGLIMMREGEFKLAEEHFRKSIELDKDSIEPYLNLSALLRGEKRFEEASTLLEKLLKKGDGDPVIHLSYALIKDEMGQYDDAIKYYRYYLREGGKHSERNRIIERLRQLEENQYKKNH
jgi:tetratricopeptide (TPR) repeat protein